ncbi:MAG: GGDEF domain-containing protein [Herminiimonas sp.]|nr:GGDEF domain-containing protein [Herminiimonas sp.]
MDFVNKIAVLFLDLDRSKNVNDTLGHEAGDDLLRLVARRVAACISEPDTLARRGGDEFVILGHAFAEEAYPAHLCETILAALAEPFDQTDDSLAPPHFLPVKKAILGTVAHRSPCRSTRPYERMACSLQ